MEANRWQPVVRLAPAAHFEVMEARITLEVQSAMLAAQRRTHAELSQLAHVVAAMRQQLPNLDLYVELDVELRLRIANATHNLMLSSLLSSLRTDMRSVIHAGLLRCHNFQQRERIQSVHEALIECIARGDSLAAGHVMRVHFSEAVLRLGEVLAP